MPHWKLKAVLNRSVAALPKRRLWYQVLQRFGSRTLSLPAHEFEAKLRDCRTHLENLRSRSACESFRAFELGTGWFPIVPVGIFLCGASHVTTCDIEPLLRPRRVRRVLELFVEYADTRKLNALLPGWMPERLDAIRNALSLPPTASAAELLEPMAISVLVEDASRLPFESASFDLIESTVVLEYIPEPVLAQIFTEFRRVLRPSGVMSHYVDLQDEYAFFDRSLSPYNFLRYSDAAWERIRNPFAPLNRLRIGDYRRLIEGAGLRILSETNRSGTPEALQSVDLDARFQGIAVEDLLVLRSWLVAAA